MIPETDLIAEIHRLADGESPPSYTKMNSLGKFAARTYELRFGGWNDALRAAGYDPNRRVNVSERELLNEVRRLADGESAPTEGKMRSNGRFDVTTYHRRFGSWWQAVVQTGCTPRERRPLTDQQFEHMVAAAHNQQRPQWKLITLLHLFTGLPPAYLSAITADRVTSHASGTLVTIPSTETQSGDDWQFKLPAAWGDGEETGLPGLLTWYLNTHGQLEVSRQTAENIVRRITRDTNIDRPTAETEFGSTLNTTPDDLRATGGVRMARNGAPARRIRRHLGIEHTNWNADVEDFFLWCEIHDDDFSHPDYEPSGTYLDPDSGDLTQIESEGD